MPSTATVKRSKPKSTNEQATKLAALAPRIKQAHDRYIEGSRKSLAHAREAGRLLLEAKGLGTHGQWEQWVKHNCQFSLRTAEAYMRIADRWKDLEAKAQDLALLGIEQALQTLAQRKQEKQAVPRTPALKRRSPGPSQPPPEGACERNGRSHEDDPVGSPAILKMTGTEVSPPQPAVTPKEIQAVQTFVEAVGGWTRANWLIVECHQQWLENQDG